MADIPLAPATAMSIRDARFVSARRDTRLVLLIGPVRSGKTTLLVAAYEALLRGDSLVPIRFARSETLWGFEERSHLSRIASGLAAPDTERTGVEDVGLLHLELVHPVQGRHDMLFGDLSGEIFQRLRDGVDPVEQNPLIRRADDLVLVLDGGRLSNHALRHAVVPDAIATFRAISESGAASGVSKWTIVISKWDLVHEAGANESATEAGSQVRAAIQELGVDVALVSTAARSTRDGGVEAGTGLRAGFERWMTPATERPPRARIQVLAGRAFNNLRPASDA
jgi:hypothetical protein